MNSLSTLDANSTRSTASQSIVSSRSEYRIYKKREPEPLLDLEKLKLQDLVVKKAEDVDANPSKKKKKKWKLVWSVGGVSGK